MKPRSYSFMSIMLVKSDLISVWYNACLLRVIGLRVYSQIAGKIKMGMKGERDTAINSALESGGVSCQLGQRIWSKMPRILNIRKSERIR